MPPSGCLSASPIAQTTLVSWEGDSVAPPEARGLWSAGFIVNRREILTRLGAQEKSSDLELASALYERFGKEAPRLIHGPFAWMLWDGARQRLVAVRDRLGIHELCFRQSDGGLLLAGGIEPLLETPRPDVNPRSVLAHLSGRVPAPGETFYRGIFAVEPGGLLTATRERIETEIYWRPEPQPLLRLPDEAAYGRAFRDLLLAIIAEYTPAGEVGVTLSGGLDSTAIAAAVREAAPASPLTAISWITPELPEADESAAVSMVCRQLGCRSVTIAADQYRSLNGEPTIRSEPASPYFNFYNGLWDATFRIANERGVRVLFSGLSGDHLFGGDVFSYPDLLLTGRWRKLASEIRDQARHSELTALQIVRWMALAPIANAYIPGWERDRTPSTAWIGEALRREAPVELPQLPRRLLPGRRERFRLLRDPLLRMVASQATRHAARYSIDFRHPLLDHRLFDFAAALPTAQTFSAGKRKVIVRSAMRGRLPDAVLDQRGKTYPDAIFRHGLGERDREEAPGADDEHARRENGFCQRTPGAYGLQRLPGRTRLARPLLARSHP